MVGNNPFNRTAQQQFEVLDTDGKKTLHDAYTASPEETDWETDTIYSKKKNQRTV